MRSTGMLFLIEIGRHSETLLQVLLIVLAIAVTPARSAITSFKV